MGHDDARSLTGNERRDDKGTGRPDRKSGSQIPQPLSKYFDPRRQGMPATKSKTRPQKTWPHSQNKITQSSGASPRLRNRDSEIPDRPARAFHQQSERKRHPHDQGAAENLWLLPVFRRGPNLLPRAELSLHLQK